MHLLKLVNLVGIILGSPSEDQNSNVIKILSASAPILSCLAATANLILAVAIFRYTRQKNQTDISLKWFQELIYTPNKENIRNYFSSLHNIKIPPAQEFTEEEKIRLINVVKDLRNSIMLEFVDAIRPASTSVYEAISKAIDKLTDDLTNALDNDELKLDHHKTYNREFTNRIANCRNLVYKTLLLYRG